MRKYAYLFSIFLCVTCIPSFHAQEKLLDSLKNILNNTKEVQQITNTYNNIGKVFNGINTDSAMVYLRIAEKMAVENKLTRHLFQSYSNIGTTFIKTGQLDSSEVYFDKAKDLLDQVDYYQALSQYYGDRGILDYYKGDYQKSGEKFEKALDLAIENKDSENIIRYTNNTGLVLSKTGNNEKALEVYFKALDAAERDKDSLHIGMLLSNVANVYEDLNEQEKSLELYKKSLSIKLKHATFIEIINAYYNVASRQLDIGVMNNDSLLVVHAEENYKKVVELSEEKNYGNGKLLGLQGLGKIALNNQDYTKAKTLFTKLLELAEATNNTPYINTTNLSLAYVENDLNNYKQAEKHLNAVKDVVLKSGSIMQKKQLFENLYIVEEKKGNYKKAFNYLLEKNKIDEDLTRDETKEKIAFFEVKFETEKKEREIIEQKKQLLEQELALKNRNLYATIITAFLIILGIIFFSIYKRNQLKRKQLQKEIDLKDALATIRTQNRLQEQRLRISRDLHDNIGSQLTFIISSIDNLKYVSKNASVKLQNKLSEISSFTGDTIHQLRDTIWAMNKSEITLEDLQARILSFIEKARSVSENTEITISNTTDQSLVLNSISGMNCFRTIQESINNALKYAEATKITIEMMSKNKTLFISIKDNGKGFDMNKVTLGNGLSNIERRMSEIDAKAHIVSSENKGTEISLEVPIES